MLLEFPKEDWARDVNIVLTDTKMVDISKEVKPLNKGKTSRW